MTTPEKIADYLLITIDEAYQPKVQEFIDSVTAFIERYTGRKFSAEETASPRFYDGTGNGEIYIDDATEVTEVKIKDTVLASSDYLLYPSNQLPKTRIILPYKTFYAGAQNVRITAKWGYGEDVPPDLAFAATVMVAGIINSQNTDSKEIQSETIGRYSVSYKTNSSQQNDFSNAKKILKLYRRFS